MKLIEKLISSEEPLIRLKTYKKLLNYSSEDKEVQKIEEEIITSSELVKSFFKYLPKDKANNPFHVYKKWQGVHWLLSILADLEYPPNDSLLLPSAHFELQWLLSASRWARKKTINGLKRFCASQEGNGLNFLIKLDLAEVDDYKILIKRLIKFQWPDGGWNCDNKPSASKSSYHESLIPLRALNTYLSLKKGIYQKEVEKTIKRSTELFLRRELYKKLNSEEIIDSNWLKLSYPSYWHYDLLSALKILAECRKILDARCNSALDLLESKILPDGGFPAEIKYYTLQGKSNSSPYNWGGVNSNKMNPWVTLDAFFVLKEAKRIELEI